MIENPPMKPTWAQAIERRRLELGKSQDHIALDAGMSQAYYSKIERGVQDLGSLTQTRLMALAEALQWSLLELQRTTGVALGIPTGDSPPTPTHPPVHPSFPRFISSMSDEHPELLNPEVQAKLLSTYGFTGPSETVTAWLELYLFLKKRGLFEKKRN